MTLASILNMVKQVLSMFSSIQAVLAAIQKEQLRQGAVQTAQGTQLSLLSTEQLRQGTVQATQGQQLDQIYAQVVPPLPVSFKVELSVGPRPTQ